MEETIKLDEKVSVKSLAQWPTGARRLLSVGDIMIPAGGFIQLSREEIIAQVQSGNRLFTGGAFGVDHATWFIDDAWTRKEVGIDTDTKTQEFLDKNSVKKIFDLKTKKAFEDQIKKRIKTDAEKCTLMAILNELKINDYARIRFCEEYTGIRY